MFFIFYKFTYTIILRLPMLIDRGMPAL